MNDIVKEVNGIKTNDMNTLFRLYNELKDNEIEVRVERNGKSLYILYILK